MYIAVNHNTSEAHANLQPWVSHNFALMLLYVSTAHDALQARRGLVHRVVCAHTRISSKRMRNKVRAQRRIRTEVLERVRAGVEEEALPAGLFDLERGDERVRDVAHVDELRRVVVHFVVGARGRELLEDDLGGQVEVLYGLPLQTGWVSGGLRIRDAETYVMDDRLQRE